MFKKLSILSILYLFFLIFPIAEDAFISKLQRSIVQVDVNKMYSQISLGKPRAFQSAGILLNKKEGIILTDIDTSAPDSIANFIVTFYGGKQSIAKRLYSDPVSNFAFLKIEDLGMIPEDSVEARFATALPSKYETVLYCNKIGESDTYITASVSQVNKVSEHTLYKTRYEVFSLKSDLAGGNESGFIFNIDGELLGMAYKSTSKEDTFTAIPILYVNDMLSSVLDFNLDRTKKIKRVKINVMLGLANSQDIIRHTDGINYDIEGYLSKFKSANKKVLFVGSVLSEDAAQLLRVGDIVLAVNDVNIGISLVDFTRELHKKSNEGFVKLTILRIENNKYVKKEIVQKLYDSTVFAKDMVVCDERVYIDTVLDQVINVFGATDHNAVYRYDRKPTIILKLFDKKVSNLDELLSLFSEFGDRKYGMGVITTKFSDELDKPNIKARFISMLIWNMESAIRYTWNDEKLDWDKKVINLKKK